MHRYKLHKHVRFFGFVPDATLAILYRLARVFVFPSLYEGFGLPPLEAMASGTPVITSNVSSLPEVVGDAAMLIDPYQPDAIAGAMRRVMLDDRLRDDMRERGLVRAREFSWGRSVTRDQGDLRRGARGVTERSGLRVALVHDWLTGMRGGEKVLDALCEIFPAAPLYTLVRVPGSVSARIEARPIHTSFVQRLPSRAGSTVITCRSTRSPSSCSTLAVRPRHQQQPLRGEVGEGPADDGSRLLLPLADAVCLGSVRRVLRPGSGRRTEEPADAPDHAPDGPLGSGHGGTRRPLSRELSICCGEDRPIL